MPRTAAPQEMSATRRVVHVVDALAQRGPIGLRPLAQVLGIPLGSLHRQLHDLMAEGVVDRTPDGLWELSFRLLQISGRQLERIALPKLARPYCERIAEATRETVNLTLLNGLAAVCLDKVRGNEAMQLDIPVGGRGKLHCGGAGKAILAYLRKDELDTILGDEIEAFTPFTLTRPADLRREIGAIRLRGYAIDNQEVVLGVYCVGVPIFDRNLRPVGAISITGPKPKRVGSDILPYVAMLADACMQVSRRLGYSGAWPPEPVGTRTEKPKPSIRAKAARGIRG
jgi:DNA-binding IclR family transcriptional regulator